MLALRLVLLLVYTAPLTVPVLAIVLHAADHRIDEARRDLAWGLPDSYLDGADAPHSHPFVGDHVHGEAGGHGGAVGLVLAAADAVDDETDAGATMGAPLRLAAHLPAALPFQAPLDVAADSILRDGTSARCAPSFTPPTPPPRSPVSA